MIKHKKTHETLPIDEPDLELEEYMDEEEPEEDSEEEADFSYMKNVNLFAEWDVNDMWQSLRKEEEAMEKYLNNKKK